MLGMSRLAVLFLTVAVVGCGLFILKGGAGRQDVESAISFEDLRLKIVKVYPHDRRAFTQGLLFFEEKFYESTGKVGFSSLRRFVPESGEVEKRRRLEVPYFGEGLARVGRDLYQLTYKRGKCFVWDLDTFEAKGSFDYSGEGWGLCYDGKHLIMSDGSSSLVYRDPRTFEEVRRIDVKLNDTSQPGLNELEYVDGLIYANVWQEDTILRIEPEDGQVNGVVDGRGLRRGLGLTDEVLNGIAYNAKRKTFYLTGKYWPKLFEVEILPLTRK